MSAMRERWALTSPLADTAERANFGAGCDRIIGVPGIERGHAYIIDPDQLHLTDLRTGETRSARDIFPLNVKDAPPAEADRAQDDSG